MTISPEPSLRYPLPRSRTFDPNSRGRGNSHFLRAAGKRNGAWQCPWRARRSLFGSIVIACAVEAIKVWLAGGYRNSVALAPKLPSSG